MQEKRVWRLAMALLMLGIVGALSACADSAGGYGDGYSGPGYGGYGPMGGGPGPMGGGDGDGDGD